MFLISEAVDFYSDHVETGMPDGWVITVR